MITEWPAEGGEYKLAVVEVRGKRVAAFGTDVYHSDLLLRALDWERIDPKMREIERNKRKVEIPEAQGDGYKAVAMGYSVVSGKRIDVYGNSDDYGLPIAAEHLRGLAPEGWEVHTLGE